jgi:hypothetical protein
MLEIVFLACSLLAADGHCKSVHLMANPGETLVGLVSDPIYAEASPITPVSCAKNAQTEMAKWQGENPNWSVGRGGFKCQPASTMAKI